MSEISELILLLNNNTKSKWAVLRDEHREQMTMLHEQLKTLQTGLNNPRENVPTLMTSFDSTCKLWTDYVTLFPKTCKHKFFLSTNLTPRVDWRYKTFKIALKSVFIPREESSE